MRSRDFQPTPPVTDCSNSSEKVIMLIDISSGKPFHRVPYEDQFNTLRARLSAEDFQAILDRVNVLIDAGGAEIATAGWLPGNDWTGTPFEPIYTVAAGRNYELSARFFGQVVWFTIMNRPEQWASGRFEKDGVDIGSRTYFRIGAR
jgi:hypothetical protein